MVGTLGWCTRGGDDVLLLVRQNVLIAWKKEERGGLQL